MNTTRSTIDRVVLPYTVVGGAGLERRRRNELAVLLINRGGRFSRSAMLRELESAGADEILSLETATESYDIEQLSQNHPEVRFLLLKQMLNWGEQINLAMNETTAEYVFVMWNDIRPRGLSKRVVERLTAANALCVTPLICNVQNEITPTSFAPSFYRKRLKVLPLVVSHDEGPTLYPYQYVGIYRRRHFLLTGGYDPGIRNPYWQRLDFGFRAWMWGESILSTTAITVFERDERPPDDTTPDEAYKRFYLKNLAPRFVGDSCHLPRMQALSFAFRAGGSPMRNLRLFREVRQWVYTHRYRFKQDARRVTELWSQRR